MSQLIWKVEFHDNDLDWANNKFTIKEFNTFDDAKECFMIKSSNHMGSVRIIHPE